MLGGAATGAGAEERLMDGAWSGVFSWLGLLGSRWRIRGVGLTRLPHNPCGAAHSCVQDRVPRGLLFASLVRLDQTRLLPVREERQQVFVNKSVGARGDKVVGRCTERDLEALGWQATASHYRRRGGSVDGALLMLLL